MLIFLDLKNTKEDYINPIKFINNYKSTIIDIHEQNDTYEFLIDILDKLEDDLKKSNQKDLIKNDFANNFYIQYDFLCKHKLIKEENVLALELEIHICKTFNKAIDLFFPKNICLMKIKFIVLNVINILRVKGLKK